MERLANNNPPPIITGWKGLANLLSIHPKSAANLWPAKGIPVRHTPAGKVFFVLSELIDWLVIYDDYRSQTAKNRAATLPRDHSTHRFKKP